MINSSLIAVIKKELVHPIVTPSGTFAHSPILPGMKDWNPCLRDILRTYMNND
jgi:hypothetical protein